LLGGIFKGNDTGEATRKQYASTVNTINGFEPKISALSDSELRDKTFALRERAQKGESLDSLLPVSLINLFINRLNEINIDCS
jgi:preprotein translocase subunit SecA